MPGNNITGGTDMLAHPPLGTFAVTLADGGDNHMMLLVGTTEIFRLVPVKGTVINNRQGQGVAGDFFSRALSASFNKVT